ncbi:hypothetical protein HZ326_16742 [Fusarium oxysporum f. sp. albedinis]|nr:hypothetical protein HZ326_16742 [Fusarium oxysporum f. sp. albedinis]
MGANNTVQNISTVSTPCPVSIIPCSRLSSPGLASLFFFLPPISSWSTSFLLFPPPFFSPSSTPSLIARPVRHSPRRPLLLIANSTSTDPVLLQTFASRRAIVLFSLTSFDLTAVVS